MNKVTNVIIAAFSVLIFLMGCNEGKTDSPYQEILNRPPFVSLTDSINKFPENDDLLFRRAVLLNENNYPEPALDDFKKAWSLSKKEQYALGVGTLLLENKPGEAVSFLQEALKVMPGNVLLQLSLARAYDQQQRIPEALELCDEVLQKNPERADVIKFKAGLLDKSGKKEEAMQALQNAYAMAPYDVELNYVLALRYAEAKNSRVINLCDSLIRADSLGIHPEPYYYKGIYYSNINDKVKALQQFDIAVRRDYNFLDGYIEKGAVLFDMKKYKEALAVFNLALTISPEFPASYYWIGKCQQAMGQIEEARLSYQKAYGLDKGFTEARDSANKLK